MSGHTGDSSIDHRHSRVREESARKGKEFQGRLLQSGRRVELKACADSRGEARRQRPPRA